MNKIERIEIDKDSNSVIISVNPKIFPLEVIYSAAYVFLDKVYVMMDSDSQGNIIVQLKAKNNDQDLQVLALDFNNELISYSVYVVQAARTNEIRKAIVERALSNFTDTEKSEKECTCNEDDYEFDDDPLDIAKPWTPKSAEGLKLDETDE